MSPEPGHVKTWEMKSKYNLPAGKTSRTCPTVTLDHISSSTWLCCNHSFVSAVYFQDGLSNTICTLYAL